MPIIERTEKACFDRFVSHASGLIASTVTNVFPLFGRQAGTRMTLSFRQGKPVAVPLETDYGTLYFYLGQALQAEPMERGHQLRTLKYWYRIQQDPSLTSQAALRWEYDSATQPDGPARNHAQFEAEVALGSGSLDLNKAHMPTGWVTMEEVIRFLIIELGSKPPCGSSWPEKLAESERKFYGHYADEGDLGA